MSDNDPFGDFISEMQMPEPPEDDNEHRLLDECYLQIQDVPLEVLMADINDVDEHIIDLIAEAPDAAHGVIWMVHLYRALMEADDGEAPLGV